MPGSSKPPSTSDLTQQNQEFLLAWIVKAVVWYAEVRKTRQEGSLHTARSCAVCDRGCCRVRSVLRVDQGIGSTGYRTQFDGDGIVSDSAAIRKSGEIAPQDSENARF